MIDKKDYKNSLIELYEKNGCYRKPTSAEIKNGFNMIMAIDRGHKLIVPVVANNSTASGFKPPYELVPNMNIKNKYASILYEGKPFEMISIGGEGMYSRLEELIQLGLIKLEGLVTQMIVHDKDTVHQSIIRTTYYVYS